MALLTKLDEVTANHSMNCLMLLHESTIFHSMN